LLDHIINSDELSTKMDMDEICTLISSSSSTLSEFFQNATQIIENEVPKFGCIIHNSPSYIVSDEIFLDENLHQ
jgi:hypothetical protein